MLAEAEQAFPDKARAFTAEPSEPTKQESAVEFSDATQLQLLHTVSSAPQHAAPRRAGFR